MSTTQANSANSTNPTSAHKPIQERRRRRRAKISAQAQVKMAPGQALPLKKSA